MKNLKKSFLFLAVISVLLLIIGGCNAKDKATGDKEAPLRIAVTEASPPFSFVNSEGKLVGFDVDYANEVGKRLNREVQIISTAWEGILPGLLADKYDLIIGSMAITDERLKSVNFSKPYYVSGAAIVVHKDNDTILSPADLKDRNVGVTLGTTYEEEVNKLGGNAKTYNTEVDQLTDLENKRIEAMVTDKFIGAFTIKEIGRPLKLLDDLLYEEKIGVALRKDDTKLLEEVNKAIDGIVADGTYEKLAMDHFGTK